jgi:tetratricopeptide (TPR) repeat protein
MPFPPFVRTSGGRVPAPEQSSPQPAGENVEQVANPLQGQVVVFTGKLSSLGRKDANALVTRLGGTTNEDVNAKTTMLVVGAEGFGSASDSAPARSQKLIRAEELNAQQPAATPIRILSEDQFCRLAGVSSPEAIRRQYYATRDLLARYRSLRDDHMRYLVKCGVIRPVLRTNADTFFAFSDLGVIKQANDDLAQGASFRSVVRTLAASRAGQLAFDFRIEAAPAKIITLRRPAEERALRLPQSASASSKDAARAADVGAVVRDTRRAEEYFRAGSALDDGNEANVEEAAIAYRKALECDPYLVAALINLANIHYGRDDLAEAQALYERAIGLESDFFEAHFNLGNIYHDLNRFPEAQGCYREALRLNPLYADAHFYLAVTFEKMGLSQDARPHWRSYRQLAPQGEWVELAKEFSE